MKILGPGAAPPEGEGKIIVLHYYYLNCSADLDSLIMSEASFRALDDFCSPSAAMTLALASLAASASAAIARCSCIGSRTSFTSTRSTWRKEELLKKIHEKYHFSDRIIRKN